MKRTIIAVTLIVGIVGGLAAWVPNSSRTSREYHDQLLASLPVEPLSSAEEEALLYMLEEEKLARDVYMELYESSRLRTFDRIAASEQQHMDSVLSLVERYELAIPATLGVPGAFEIEELDELYQQLVDQGRASAAAALKVGATIEDLDIADLKEDLAAADNQDIAMVFESLIAGSENHLRAFTRQLERRGGEYEPIYISQEEYGEILSAAQGRPGRADQTYRFARRPSQGSQGSGAGRSSR